MPGRPKIKANRKRKDICGAIKPNGEPCRVTAGQGTDHPGGGRCRYHDGPKGGVSEMKGMVRAGMTGVVELTPAQGVMGVLGASAVEMAYATEQIAGLSEEQMWELASSGDLVPNKWIRFRHAVMDRIVRTSKTAADIGIAERQINLAEEQTRMMGELLEGVMGELELTAKQRKKVGPAIRSQLAVIEARAREVVNG